MAICMNGPEWRAAAANHPAVLGWYLMDEPETGKTVAEVRTAYEQLKKCRRYLGASLTRGKNQATAAHSR
jgi:hypothetical protein